MDFRVICDTREMLSNGDSQRNLYSDHPSKANLDAFISAAINQGFDASYFGGVEKVIESIYEHNEFPQSVFVNFSDGLSHDYSRVQIPVLCELLNVPYSGSGVFSSAIVNNKRCSCSVVGGAGVNVPEGFCVNHRENLDKIYIESLLPVFIKPNREGSSIGITRDSLQETLVGALDQIDALLRNYGEVSVERYVDGCDITVFMLGNPPNFELIEPIVLQAEGHSFLDVEAKKSRSVRRSSSQRLLSDEEIEGVRYFSKRVFEVLECRDICRVDFRMDESRRFYFIEANSAPRFSKTSEIGFLAESAGRSFDDYVKLFLDVVRKRVSRDEAWLSKAEKALRDS